MLQQLISLYRNKFHFVEFYDRLISNIKTWPDDHIKNDNFLYGLNPSAIPPKTDYPIETQKGDIRVDLPVWFGNSNSIKRIVIIGSEPRDSDKSGRLNVERNDRYVFATPFALDRPKGKYQHAFSEILSKPDIFAYFTDVVKEYEVGINKENDDKKARELFHASALKGKDFLLEELDIIKPSNIIALGNNSHQLLNKILGSNFTIDKIRHPSYGGSIKAKEELRSLAFSQ